MSQKIRSTITAEIAANFPDNTVGAITAADLRAVTNDLNDSCFNLLSDVPVQLAQGGTGQITANNALNALLPSQAGNSGKVLGTNGTNTSWITGGGGGTPGGANTSIQYNNSGTFGGFGTFNGTYLSLPNGQAFQGQYTNLNGTAYINPDGSAVFAAGNIVINSTGNISTTGSLEVDDGAHIEKSGSVLTSAPSGNQFDQEGGCDGTSFSIGDVLQVRIRSYKVVGATQYGSTITSNTYTHTFISNACVDAEFQGDDFATVDGWVVEQNLNGGGWGISNTVGNILSAPGTITYHLENNGNAPLLPTTISTSVELGGYNDGTRVYSVYSTDPGHFSSIFLDDPLPVSAGGTGQSNGTLTDGAVRSVDFYHHQLFNNSGTLIYDYGVNLIYDNTGANESIDPANRQLLDNSGAVKIDYNLGWIYISGKVRLLMNNIPTFAAGITTDVCLKLLPSGAGYSADLLQLRNTSDSANLASFNNLAKLVACASTTAGASINIPSGTAPTSPVDGDMWEASNHLFARLNGVTYQLDQQTGTGVTSVAGTANRITSTGGTTPVIDISASYVGQSSITTLGTIATGVWQGTVIDATHGGTGVNNGSNTLTISGASATVPVGGALYPLKISRVTGSNATTTGQTLVDITGLSVALDANAVYKYETSLSIGTSAVNTGTQYGINYSAAGATIEGGYAGTTTDTSNNTNRIHAFNTAGDTFLTTSSSTNGNFTSQGIVRTGANAGNLTVQHLKVTSGTSTVFIDSYLIVTKIA